MSRRSRNAGKPVGPTTKPSARGGRIAARSLAPRVLDDYAAVVGAERIAVLRRMAARLKGMRLVMVNSTRYGGGVAELLSRQIPLLNELGIETRWEVMDGTPEFFDATKAMHNALQGARLELTPSRIDAYMGSNRDNAKRLNLDADLVVIHDPQPAALIDFAPKRCPWVWRCHIDASRPSRPFWLFLRQFVSRYDASIFSMASFSKNLPHPQYLIPPSIDPLSAKNYELTREEIDAVLEQYGIDARRPIVVQISRFDRFKDPIGVIRAFRMVRRRDDAQLVLAGGGAADDPEGAGVLAEVTAAVNGDPDIHILDIPPDSHRLVNALQRAATVIVQKSLKEGFGLTVTEGLWKGRPVLGGAVGGITLQVVNHQTGFLVHSVEGLAFRLRYLLNRPRLADEMGVRGRELVRSHFLLPRHLRDWLTLFLAVKGDTVPDVLGEDDLSAPGHPGNDGSAL